MAIEIRLKKKYRTATTAKSTTTYRTRTGNSHGPTPKRKKIKLSGKFLREAQIATAKGMPWTEDYAKYWGENGIRN